MFILKCFKFKVFEKKILVIDCGINSIKYKYHQQYTAAKYFLFQCQRSIWRDLSNKCGSYKRWALHLHSPWNIYVILSNWHHMVSIRWSKLWDEVWKLDLQWLQGNSVLYYKAIWWFSWRIMMLHNEFIHIHKSWNKYQKIFFVPAWFPAGGWRRGHGNFYSKWRVGLVRWYRKLFNYPLYWWMQALRLQETRLSTTAAPSLT